MFVQNWTSQLDPAVSYLSLCTVRPVYQRAGATMDVLLQELENKSDGPGVNRAGFGFQGGNKPFFPRGRGGKPAFGGSNRFSSAPPWFMQPAAGRANNKGHCPPDTCISSALPDSCSRHKLDTTDLTRLDQARERVMGKDLRGRILVILIHWKIMKIFKLLFS